nr:MAG TPA: hypothetical protein [Caudoviricetes sp.]
MQEKKHQLSPIVLDSILQKKPKVSVSQLIL